MKKVRLSLLAVVLSVFLLSCGTDGGTRTSAENVMTTVNVIDDLAGTSWKTGRYVHTFNEDMTNITTSKGESYSITRVGECISFGPSIINVKYCLVDGKVVKTVRKDGKTIVTNPQQVR